jgi:hypothetical protein
MSKIDVNKVAEILKKNQVEPKILRQVVEEMNLLTQAQADEEKPPAQKKQHAILISMPDLTKESVKETSEALEALCKAAFGSEEDAIIAFYKHIILEQLRKLHVDRVGWVLQIPEDESPATTQDRIFRAAYDFATTRKGRLMPAKTVAEALENIPAKHFKEVGVWVKTKIPVLMLTTDNQIPYERADH